MYKAKPHLAASSWSVGAWIHYHVGSCTAYSISYYCSDFKYLWSHGLFIHIHNIYKGLFVLFIPKTVVSLAGLTPKDDLYGLGFDPLKEMPEFKAASKLSYIRITMAYLL